MGKNLQCPRAAWRQFKVAPEFDLELKESGDSAFFVYLKRSGIGNARTYKTIHCFVVQSGSILRVGMAEMLNHLGNKPVPAIVV